MSVSRVSESFRDLCPEYEVSVFGPSVTRVSHLHFGGAAPVWEVSKKSLGIDNQGIKFPHTLGRGIPSCEVCERVVHLYPRTLVLGHIWDLNPSVHGGI